MPSSNSSSVTLKSSMSDDMDDNRSSAQDVFLQKSESAYHQEEARTWHKRHHISIPILAAQMGFFCVSFILFISAWALHQDGVKVVYKNTTIFDNHVDHSYEIKHFNDEQSSPFRPHTLEAQAEWLRLEGSGPFGVSAEIIEEIGGPDVFNKTVKLRKDQGSGYMVDVAVFHHLHCVRLLWEHVHWDYFGTREPLFQEDMAGIHMHLDHCADFVRQALMCHPDTTLLTYNWKVEGELVQPFLGNTRTCRNHEELLDFSTKNAWNTVDLP